MTDAGDWPPRPTADDPQHSDVPQPADGSQHSDGSQSGDGDAQEWTSLDAAWTADAPPPRNDPYPPAGPWQLPYSQNPYSQIPYSQLPHGQNPYGAPHPGHPLPPSWPGQYGAARPPFAGAPTPQAATRVLPTPPSLGRGLRWAWAMFVPNAAVMVAAALVWAIAFVIAIASTVLVLVLALILMSLDSSTNFPGFSTGVEIMVSVVPAILMAFVGSVAMACWFNGLIGIADGRRVDLGDFFRPRAFGSILGVTVLVSLVAVVIDIVVAGQLGLPWVATLLELVVAFLTMWTMYVAADQETDLAGALKGGISLLLERPGPSVVAFLVTTLLVCVGAVALLVGLLVAVPISSLLMMHYLRSLTQRPIAVADGHPATPAH